MQILPSSDASQLEAGNFLKVADPRLAFYAFQIFWRFKFKCSDGDKAFVACQVDLTVDPSDDSFLVSLFKYNVTIIFFIPSYLLPTVFQTIMHVQQLPNLQLMFKTTLTRYQGSLCIELEIWKTLKPQIWVKLDLQLMAFPSTTRTTLHAVMLAYTSCMRWIFVMRTRMAKEASITTMFGLHASQNALALLNLLESR